MGMSVGPKPGESLGITCGSLKNTDAWLTLYIQSDCVCY